MDNQIIRDLFRNCAKAAMLLGVDEPLRGRLIECAAKLPPMQVGKEGSFRSGSKTGMDRFPSHIIGIHRISMASIQAARSLPTSRNCMRAPA